MKNHNYNQKNSDSLELSQNTYRTVPNSKFDVPFYRSIIKNLKLILKAKNGSFQKR